MCSAHAAIRVSRLKAEQPISKKAARNKSIKSGVKTSVKKVEAAIAAGDKAAAVSALNAFKAEMGRATSKGVYKKNTNSRKVGRMSKKVDAMA